ncbi:MAG: DUF4149 domain-containing protein [Candidatus Rokubacteria bacterium]|nr:DUF4149 domain-containing protein [Candidatus Rokubacteria bacterium]
MNSLKILTISAVSIWLGAMAFFSLFVAPQAFSVLDRESAGRLVTAVFPRYYFFGIVLGAVGLAGVAGQILGDGGRRAPWGTLSLLLLMLILTFYAMLVLLPQIETARQAMRSAGALPGSAAPEARAFARLHLVSVVLNGVTLLAGLLLVGLEAARAQR